MSAVSHQVLELLARAIVSYRIPLDSVSHADTVANSFSSIVMLVHFHSGDILVWKCPFTLKKGVWEVKVLKGLAHLSYIPQVIYDSQIANKYSIMMGRLPGRPLTSAPEAEPLLFKKLGRALATIHRDGLGITAPLTTKPKDWWRSRLRIDFVTRTRICRDAFGTNWPRLTSRFDELLALLAVNQQLCFVHGDFRLANVLYDDQSITGIVDFESSYIGLPHVDILRMISELGGVSTIRARSFLNGYGEERLIPPDLEISSDLFQLHHSVASISWCIKRGDWNSEFFNLHLDRAMKICASSSQ